MYGEGRDRPLVRPFVCGYPVPLKNELYPSRAFHVFSSLMDAETFRLEPPRSPESGALHALTCMVELEPHVALGLPMRVGFTHMRIMF